MLWMVGHLSFAEASDIDKVEAFRAMAFTAIRICNHVIWLLHEVIFSNSTHQMGPSGQHPDMKMLSVLTPLI